MPAQHRTMPLSRLSPVLMGVLLLVGEALVVPAASRKPDSAPAPGVDPTHRDDPPGNDPCELALWITDTEVPFSTLGATTDGPPDANCQFDGQVYNDIWFKAASPLTGLLWLTLCGSSYDTDLAVYEGWDCPVDGTRLLGCNDDGCPGNGPQRYRSRLVLPVIQGQELLFRVGGYGSWDRGQGELELDWEETVQGCPLDGLLEGPGWITGSTEGGWQLGSAGCGYSTWSPAGIVALVPDCTGTWQASLCGSGYDTVLSVHDGCPPTAQNQLACNDDACGLSSVVDFQATEGQPVYLRLSGYNGASGDYQLLVTGPSCTTPAPANDACDQAQPLGEGATPLTTLGALPDGPQPSGTCGGQASSPFGGDVWYLYTAPGDGTTVFDLCDGDWDSQLALYPGGTCPPPADSLLACNDDACGLQSRLEVPVAAGLCYLLRVGGFGEARGSGLLQVSHQPGCLPLALPAPVVTIARSDSLVQLGWSPVTESLEGCVLEGVEYRVWRRWQEGPWLELGRTTHTFFEDDPAYGDGTCRYRVTALLP